MTPVILLISGLDPTGGAGIGADMRACSALKAYSMPVVSALTVQNQHGVSRVEPVATDIIIAQLDAVYEAVRPDAVKIGLVPEATLLGAITDFLGNKKQDNIVVDPVLSATRGGKLANTSHRPELYRRLSRIARLFTPNSAEADLIGFSPEFIKESGCSLLITGGDKNGNYSTDILYEQGSAPLLISSFRIQGHNMHGTGCILSSAIAVFLARRYPLPEACMAAKEFVSDSLKKANAFQTDIMPDYGPSLIS